MDRTDMKDFIVKVREAEKIFIRLSKDQRTLALHFLQSAIQRCSLIMCARSEKQIPTVYRNRSNTGKFKEGMEEDPIGPVCVLLEELLSKVIEISETGSQNIEISENGLQNIEISETSSQNIGMSKTGSQNIEISNTGSQSIGMSKTGSQKIDISETGSQNIGMSNTGSQNTGMSKSGSQNIEISETGLQNLEISETSSQNTEMSKTGSQNTGMLNTDSQKIKEPMDQKSEDEDQGKFLGKTSIHCKFNVSPKCSKVVSKEMHSEPDENHSAGSVHSENRGNDISVLLRRRKRTLKQIYLPSHSERKSRRPLTKDMVKQGRIERNLTNQPEGILPVKMTNRKRRLSTVGNVNGNQHTACSSCDCKFSVEILYLEHIMLEHHSHPCSCRICHKLLTSDEMPGHICECTKRRLQTISNNQTDSAREEECMNSEPGLPEKMWTCKYCNEHFVRMCDCPTEQEEGRFTCVKCGKILGNRRLYDEHIKSHASVTMSCESCEIQSPADCQSSEDCPSPEDCHSPEQKFYRQQDLKGKTEELSALGNYGCPDCNKEFSDISLLNVHHKVHTEKMPYQCSECENSFHSRKDQSKHRQEITQVGEGGAASERNHLCSECGKRYRRKQALKRHMKQHNEQSPYQCEFCHYSSLESNNLKRHMALHFEAKRNFMCEICGAAFHAKGTLETHIAFKHTDSRLFQCDQCEASFKVKNTLKRHLLVHTEEKSHKCWCGSGFKRLTNLRRHMIKLHGSADGQLPPVRRVKTLDLSKKAPISRTDFVNGNPTFPGNTSGDSNKVPIHQDITDNVLDTSMVTATQDSNSNPNATNGLPIHQNNSCCENGFPIVHPALLESRKQSGARIMSLHEESSYNPGSGTMSSQTVAFASVLKQIQEVFDFPHLDLQTENT